MRPLGLFSASRYGKWTSPAKGVLFNPNELGLPLAGQGGVWIVEFISPSAADTTTGSSTAIAANANWTRAANQSATTSSVLAWDVTVRSSGGDTINGRA